MWEKNSSTFFWFLEKYVLSLHKIIIHDNMEFIKIDFDNGNISEKQLTDGWKLLYCLMDKVKTHMDSTYAEKNGEIRDEDFLKIRNYIVDNYNNIVRICFES